jgi:hypothetical protein
MAVYNLPPLKREHQLDATMAGQWVTPPAGLNGLAADLAIERPKLRPDEIKSIPDAWAQVQLSVQAFLQPGHEASEMVQKQWRGLLALIALQPLHSEDYSLRVDGFELPQPGESTPPFQRMLRALLPTALKPEDPHQPASIGVIQFVPAGGEEVPVAMVSPEMLVAPGRQAGTVRSGLPWMARGLGDPIDSASAMRPAAWDILTQYLDQLANAVQGGGDAVALRQKLEEFANACRARKSGAETAPKSLARFNVPQFPLLARTWDATQRDGESDCLLRLAGRAGQPLAGIILADPALTETLGRSANAIKVWGSCSLADVQEDKTLRRVQGEAAQKGFAILRPEDLFTSTLVRLQGDVSIAGHPKALQNALAPIAPVALLLGAPLGLEASRSGDTYEVALEVGLQSGAKHVVRKDFDQSTTVERPAPLDLALWPNFRAEKWPWNFLRFQYTRNKDELRPRFALSTELLSSDIEAGDGSSARAQRVQEWASGDPAPVDDRLLRGDVWPDKKNENPPLFQRVRFANTATARDSGAVGEQQCVAHGIDAIFFSLPAEKQTVAAGCILPQFGERGSQKEAITVAIDFGTSNTIAYFRRDGQPAQRVSFESRVLFPVTMARNVEEIAPTYADFFPLGAVDTPMPTVLKKREYRGQQSGELSALLGDIADLEKANLILTLSHLIFFTPKIDRELSSVLIDYINKGMLRFEIKWESGADAKAIVKFYLRQLMIMIAAELVAQGGSAARIGWRMSYPRAFTTRQVRAFTGLVGELANDLFSASGGEASAPPVALRTEGEAAAAYFMQDKDQARKGLSPIVLMLDIGGGTTDIAIRCDQTLVWQGSARLAAADFFRDYLANNPEVVSDIDRDAVQSFEQGRGDAGERGFRIRQLVDLLIAKPGFEQSFAAAYSLHGEEEPWVGLGQTATVALGGLMHYCGLVLRRLSDDGVIPAGQLDMLTVFLGGRGSTFFRRLAGGGDRGSLTSICSLAAPAAGMAQIDPRFSELPKQEVARGLLILDPDRPGAARPAETLPLGLGVKVREADDSRILRPDEFIERLPAGGTVEELDMGEFAQFLARLADAAGFSVDISAPKARTATEMVARNRLAVDLRAIQPGEDPSQVLASLEPPFISALRGLVALMASSPDERSVLGIREK